LFKKILSVLSKIDSLANSTVAEKSNSNQYSDKDELLSRIKKLEDNQKEILQKQTNSSDNEEDYSLSEKQMEFAISLIEKTRDYELAVPPSKLTVKDLNRLVAFNRYKNKGAIVNLEKKGILKRKSNAFT
jgi:hypothetical protein